MSKEELKCLVIIGAVSLLLGMFAAYVI